MRRRRWFPSRGWNLQRGDNAPAFMYVCGRDGLPPPPGPRHPPSRRFPSRARGVAGRGLCPADLDQGKPRWRVERPGLARPGVCLRPGRSALRVARGKGTRFRFGNQGQCVGRGGGVDNAVVFNVTAPEDPGTYDAGFTATGAADCGGEQGTELKLTDALTVTAPATNPPIPQQCGINVILVLDESGSIESSGATEKVRRATRAFLNSLSGTGCRVSIVDFSTTAAWPVGYHVVTGSVNPDGTGATGSIGSELRAVPQEPLQPGRVDQLGGRLQASGICERRRSGPSGSRRSGRGPGGVHDRRRSDGTEPGSGAAPRPDWSRAKPRRCGARRPRLTWSRARARGSLPWASARR